MRDPVRGCSCFTILTLLLSSGSVSEAQMVSAQPKVRFEKSGGMAVVPVFINGQGPFRFVLDTGASTCLIDESLVQELKLQSRSKTRMMTAAGISEVLVYQISNLKLGDTQALNVQAASVSRNSEVLTNRKARGFLGLSFLARFNFLLDYEDQSITFEPEVTVVSSGEAVYALERSQGLYVVVLPVSKQVVRFVLDSGTDRLVLFSTEHFPYARILSTSVIRTAYGERQVSRAEISGLRLGKRVLNKEKVMTLPGQGPEGCDGLLPARIFSSLYFDNRGGRLVVNPD